jgi:hypothetical protein
MKQPIVDEFSDLPISRQRRWQLRQEKAGKCITCGKPSVKHLRCELHAKVAIIKLRENQRRRLGYKRRYVTAPSYSFTLDG